jgi:hypothetical protein
VAALGGGAISYDRGTPVRHAALHQDSHTVEYVPTR